MKNMRVAVAVLGLAIAACAVSLTLAQRHRLKTKDFATEPTVSIAGRKNWGLSHETGETQVAYPKGQPDHNTIIDRRQYGPVTIDLDHDASAAGNP